MHVCAHTRAFPRKHSPAPRSRRIHLRALVLARHHTQHPRAPRAPQQHQPPPRDRQPQHGGLVCAPRGCPLPATQALGECGERQEQVSLHTEGKGCGRASGAHVMSWRGYQMALTPGGQGGVLGPPGLVLAVSGMAWGWLCQAWPGAGCVRHGLVLAVSGMAWGWLCQASLPLAGASHFLLKVIRRGLCTLRPPGRAPGRPPGATRYASPLTGSLGMRLPPGCITADWACCAPWPPGHATYWGLPG